MNQSYSFEFLLRMDKTDLENLSLQYDIKIKRCNAHLNMLLSNFTHVNMLLSNITHEEESELYLNLITNQIYCIKELYSRGLLQFKGKYFKYLPIDVNLIIRYILRLPDIEEFENHNTDNVSEAFFHIYFIYRDILSYEDCHLLYGYIRINLQKECKDLNIITNIKNIISIDNIYVNPKYIEEYKKINNHDHIDVNIGIVCRANSIKDIFEVMHNLLNNNLMEIPIKSVKYNYDFKIIILEYINN